LDLSSTPNDSQLIYKQEYYSQITYSSQVFEREWNEPEHALCEHSLVLNGR